MSEKANPDVDRYIDSLPIWQREICREVRALVHEADPEVVETIKRRVQPYFVLEGNICALLAARDHVNVFLYEGGIVPDPEGTTLTVGGTVRDIRDDGLIEVDLTATVNGQTVLAKARAIVRPPQPVG